MTRPSAHPEPSVSATVPGTAFRRRLGLIVPSSNSTMEQELPSLLGARRLYADRAPISFHSARMRMREVTPQGLSAMNAQVERATCEIADVRPDVVANACLVAIMSQGPGAHHDSERQIAEYLEREGARAPVVSSAGALLTALAALQAQRIAIITPYARPLTQSVVDYIEDAGVEVHDALSLEVTDNRAVAALDPSDLHRHWRRLDLTGCDAIVASACVQMPSLAAIDVIEQESGLPTLSAATATAFVLLRALGLDQEVEGAGSLLRRPMVTKRPQESDNSTEEGVTYDSQV